MTLLLSESDVRELLTMPEAIAAVEEIMRRQAAGQAIVHPRHRLELPDKGFLHYMAGADVSAGLVGMKLYTSVRGALRFLVPLYRSTTGELIALIEADYLGLMRTGAASGVATRYMARTDAQTLGIIGTGHQAAGQVEGVAAVRKLTKVLVYGRDAERRARFAAEMSERIGVSVEPARSSEEAVRGADIVVTATTANRAVVEGAWLAPGTHINAVGANFPQKRELDDAAVARASRIAVDFVAQAKMEAGDLIQAFSGDAARWNSVHELSEIIGNKFPGREGAEEITLFKSSGIAIWDVAVAARVVELAVARGIGKKIPLWEGQGG
ncbi:MAG TPA: ornithine cyclodeaminase family protein [Candidatus Limnocylindrales bacterium]|nr:ornithine cyclodeaminase family protein [Candidatus Limnocylindrales bacterium]